VFATRLITQPFVGSDNNEHLLELLCEVGNKHILLLGDFSAPNIDWINHTATSVGPKSCDRDIRYCRGLHTMTIL